MNQSEKLLAQLEKKLAKEYKKALKDVTKQANEYFKKFSKQDKEMLKKLKKEEITSKDYTEWRRKKMLTGEKYQNLQNKLADDYANVNQISASMINDTLPKAYSLNYNHATYEIEKGLKVNTNFTLYNEDTVKRLAKDKPELLPKAKVDIPKDKRWNKKKINSSLTQAVLRGDSVNDLAKNLKTVTDMNQTSAIRNARTMFTGAQNGGREDSFKRAVALEIDMKQMWVSTMDRRTRHSHAVLDGETVPVGKYFSNGLRYPGDPTGEGREVYNCRCTMIADLKDAPHDLRDERVSEMTYEEWESYRQSQKIKTPVQETHKVINGKDISKTWTRRPDKFDFEIEDIINAQGFDGLPRVVNEDEFNKLVKDSKLIAQRGYVATSEDILKKYQDELYYGKWYVDCSKGGDAFGKGMYTAYNKGTKVNDRTANVVSMYGGGSMGKIETMTFDKSIKVINYDDAKDLLYEFKDKEKEIVNDFINKEVDKIDVTGIKKDYMLDRYFDIYDRERAPDTVGWYKKFTESERTKLDDEMWEITKGIKKKVDDLKNSIRNMDEGSISALYGYDAVDVERQNYLIILNRTKLIIKK